jgi:Fe-S cluster assembly protein SufD
MPVATQHDSFLLDFERVVERTSAGEPDLVQRLRAAAMDRFLALGYPTRRDEAWRHTSVAAIAEGAFATAVDPGETPAGVDLAALAVPDAHLLVFVDGHLAPALSHPRALPAGVTVGSLAEALRRAPELVVPHLGCTAATDGNPFASLNTALFRDGALVHLARGAVAERPIQLLFLGSGRARPTAAFPRVLVVAGEGSEATVVETYASLDGGGYLCCRAAEVVVGPGARVDRYVLQCESDAALHVAADNVVLGRDASFSAHTFTFGGALVRNDVGARLDGAGASLVLNGLYYATGSAHVDTHMVVDHAAPHGESHELYKGVLDGRASAVFNGLIHVHPGAQKTNAKQSNRNLLLSREALANSNPQLRIYADDVKCTHGSTVGQLDDDAIFYLRSRGIGRDEARALLTRAFAGEVVERVKPAALRAQLEALLAARLPVAGDILER